MKKLILALSLMLFAPAMTQASIESIFAPIPVQDSGRIKPFDTFARESLQLVYGKRDYNGKPATEVVFTWMIMPHHWDDIEFVKIDQKEIKEQLKLDVNKKRFSPKELLSKEQLQILFTELQTKKEAQEKLKPFFQSVERLQSQLTIYKAIGQGFVPGWIPQESSDTWIALKDFSSDYSELFLRITKAFAASLGDKSKVEDLRAAVQIFNEKAKGENLDKYPAQQKINLEVQYNQFHPFQWAWIAYVFSALFFMFYFISKKQAFYKLSLFATFVGFIIHTYGFALRIFIMERPPVTNMYETVIWVPWGAVLFSMILLKVSKNKFFIFASSIIAFVCLVLADLAPIILDPSMQPLQPVLRSNLWLTVHVLTITISYAAFFLAFILGDIALSFYLLDEKKYGTHITSLRDAIYRSIQVGVVLLGAGTILGGVWADYSWGRFWGWDPKETWALIAFLGYIAILHGRISGWIKPFGFVLWSVIAFALVVMAWYGVNYVLGAGLHSYGFGGGGLPFVSAVIGIHILFAATVWFVRLQRQK
ncbi:MAG: cytochrome c biogenesis protein CcsA [Bdellovibrionota bacterium]